MQCCGIYVRKGAMEEGEGNWLSFFGRDIKRVLLYIRTAVPHDSWHTYEQACGRRHDNRELYISRKATKIQLCFQDDTANASQLTADKRQTTQPIPTRWILNNYTSYSGQDDGGSVFRLSRKRPGFDYRQAHRGKPKVPFFEK